jgi:hypothetical protein
MQSSLSLCTLLHKAGPTFGTHHKAIRNYPFSVCHQVEKGGLRGAFYSKPDAEEFLVDNIVERIHRIRKARSPSTDKILSNSHRQELELLDNATQELVKVLSNKANCQKDWYTVRSLGLLVLQYARLGQYNGKVRGSSSTLHAHFEHQGHGAPISPGPCMSLTNGRRRQVAALLDQVGSYCIHQLRADQCCWRDEKPANFLFLLQGYATLGHNTIVLPELLNALSDQVSSSSSADIIQGVTQEMPNPLCLRAGR